MTFESIKELMSRASGAKITVVGDFCLDKYLYIDPASSAKTARAMSY